MSKNNRAIGAGVLAAIWLGLCVFAWCTPAKEHSDSERRQLAQLPEFTGQALLDGSYMEKFSDYAVDQFPLRDGFRSVKALFHSYGLLQSDNNGIYLTDGHALKMEYPMNEESVDRAISQFQVVYETYLKDSGARVVATVVPDKGYYLADGSGHLSMDYDALFTKVQTGMPWAEYVDITDCLQAQDYYRTDTHWRQEKLLPTAQKLSAALGVSGPQETDFAATKLERPFYGVYYGQAAMPVKPDEMCLMNSPVIDRCTVYNYTTQATASVYDMEKLDAKDLYEVYLSGSQSLLRIDNPQAKTGRELVIFRDSFGSSLVPLLVQDYATVMLIDIRYISAQRLGQYVDFQNKDVLFMYSSSVLNNNSI